MSAPDVFNDAVRPQFPDIKTKAEMDMLESQHRPPEPVPQLTPKGIVTPQVNTMVYERTQERLAQLRQSLDGAHCSLDKGFSQSRMAGKACVDFGQSH